MKKLFIVFNHKLTTGQIADAKETLGIAELIYPDKELSVQWSTIPPETDSVVEAVAPFLVWLRKAARPGDYVLIQGEFGATWMLVNHSFNNGLIPIYSTTVRIAEEEQTAEGEVKLSHRFKHVRFRKYGE